MEKMRIYISGPITGIKGYVEKFDEAYKRLCRRYREAIIINPAYLSVVYPGYTHDEYMHMCLILESNCTHIYMLEGWQQSSGAKEELRFALNRGMEVIGDGKAGD